MKFEPKKILIGVVAVFVLLSVWNKPNEAGESTGDFIGDAGDWLEDVWDKANEFSKSVAE